jgi:hypothetical protein
MIAMMSTTMIAAMAAATITAKIIGMTDVMMATFARSVLLHLLLRVAIPTMRFKSLIGKSTSL